MIGVNKDRAVQVKKMESGITLRSIIEPSLASYMERVKSGPFDCKNRMSDLSCRYWRALDDSNEYNMLLNSISNDDWTMGVWENRFSAMDVIEMKSHPDPQLYREEYGKYIKGLEGMGISFTKKKRRRRYEVERGELDVGRMLEKSETPFEYRDMVLKQSAIGHIKICVEFGGNSDLKNSQLENAGLAASALVDYYESRGNRCRVDIFNYMCDDRRRAGKTRTLRVVTLKQYDEPLDIEKIGLSVGCGQWFRVPHFRYMAKTALKMSSGLGVQLDIKNEPEMLAEIKDEGESMLLVPRMYSREQAQKFVKDTIENPQSLS